MVLEVREGKEDGMEGVMTDRGREGYALWAAAPRVGESVPGSRLTLGHVSLGS